MDQLRSHPPGVVLLDGGLSTTLAARGCDVSGPLWSARVLVDEPDAITAVHRDFLAAGASIITTASYQLSAAGLRAAGHDPSEEGPLLARAVTLARHAAREHAAAGGAPAAVAGSLGPYGAVLTGGREYVGRYGIGITGLRDFHRPRAEVLLAAGVDLLAFETVPSADELRAIGEVVAGSTRPTWVTATTDATGTATPEGTPLREAFAPLLEVDEVVAIGVNCVPPDRVVPALTALADLGFPLVAKPNAGARYAPEDGRWHDTTHVADPRPWVAAGARLVGGCCGTSPADLARLRARLPA